MVDNSFSKVARYKVNSKKSVFLYTNDKQTEEETREANTFTMSSKNIKYLGVNLTKQVNDLYGKNIKTMMKEIDEDIRRWKDLTCSWISRT